MLFKITCTEVIVFVLLFHQLLLPAQVYICVLHRVQASTWCSTGGVHWKLLKKLQMTCNYFSQCKHFVVLRQDLIYSPTQKFLTISWLMGRHGTFWDISTLNIHSSVNNISSSIHTHKHTNKKVSIMWSTWWSYPSEEHQQLCISCRSTLLSGSHVTHAV